jgi:hypothetical protein
MAIRTRTSQVFVASPFEAHQKLEFLIRDEMPKRILGHDGNFSDFCRKLDVCRSTLKAQRARERLSPEMQALLATKFGFKTDWQEWVSGSAADFKARYLGEAGSTRRLGKRLMRGPRSKPSSLVADLASVMIDGSQFGSGSVAISATISCGPGVISNAHFGIKCGRIELHCFPGVATMETFETWLAKGQQIQGTHGKVRLSLAAATPALPAWLVAAAGPTIGTFNLDPSFASLEELAPGDEIELRFGTWLSAIGELDAGAVLENISLLSHDGKELLGKHSRLSDRKRRIIECLRKSVLQTDKNGYVTLASHVLQVAEAST